MEAGWPLLEYGPAKESLLTLQLWSQIVGKVRLALTPWLNHSWHVPLYVNSRGFGTSGIAYGNELFEIDFDLIAHRLEVRSSTGAQAGFSLHGICVAEFHDKLFTTLAKLGVFVAIDPRPQEMGEATALNADWHHSAYDPERVHAYWRALILVDRVLKHFRTGFIGKASPIHLFWGAFDLAVTRFSGRPAPEHPGMPGLLHVMREAYSHEVSSAGFWPGSEAYPKPAFYSYAYPEPDGFRDSQMPEGAFYEGEMGEFVMPYEAVRKAPDPDAVLLRFLEATYGAAADLGAWPRADLESGLGWFGTPRKV